MTTNEGQGLNQNSLGTEFSKPEAPADEELRP